MASHATAANDNRQGAHHPAGAAYLVFKAIQGRASPADLYGKVAEFFAAAGRSGIPWQDSAALRRLDNLLCRHECGMQPLSAERTALLLGEWLAEECVRLAAADLGQAAMRPPVEAAG